MNLNGKTALVTGASSGIGFGIAQALSKAGCKVIINSKSKQTHCPGQCCQQDVAFYRLLLQSRQNYTSLCVFTNSELNIESTTF